MPLRALTPDEGDESGGLGGLGGLVYHHHLEHPVAQAGVAAPRARRRNHLRPAGGRAGGAAGALIGRERRVLREALREVLRPPAGLPSGQAWSGVQAEGGPQGAVTAACSLLRREPCTQLLPLRCPASRLCLLLSFLPFCIALIQSNTQNRRTKEKHNNKRPRTSAPSSTSSTASANAASALRSYSAICCFISCSSKRPSAQLRRPSFMRRRSS